MANRSLNRTDLPSASTTSSECISAQVLAEQLGSRVITVIDGREPMENITDAGVRSGIELAIGPN